MKPTLSLVILTHNSAHLLAKHIAEYALQVDEIIFIDNHSQDTIRDLAKKVHAKVITHSLENDFAQQRNTAFSAVTSDWTFFVDSDEYVSPELWAEIHQRIESDEFEAFRVFRQDFFLGKVLKYGETGNISLLRLAKTEIGRNTWQRPVHEVWNVPTDRIGQTTNALLHTPHQNIQSFLAKLHWYASFEPHSRQKYGLLQICFEIIFYPLGKFVYNYLFKQGYRDGVRGLIHAILMSYYSLITRIYLYETWHT